MADSQKMASGAKSGGQRIDDHSFFAGGMSKDSVLPKGVHTKHYSSAEGAGSETDYEDTSEAIKSVQERNKSKAKAHPQKQGYRN